MSTSSRAPSAPARTELETVVNWPLLLSAAGLGFLILAVPAVLACVAACKGDVVKDEVVSRRELPPADASPVATPARTLASFTPPAEAETPLPVFTEGRQRNKPAPAPAPSSVAAKPPPLDPILMGPKAAEPPAPPRPLKRIDVSSEESLIANLADVAKEVDLESIKGTRARLLAKARASKPKDKVSHPILALCAERADLKGLPMLGEARCRADEAATKNMAAISQGLRQYVRSRPAPSSSSYYSPTPYLASELADRKEWFQDDGISVVTQMLQVEASTIRRDLVGVLAAVDGSKPSAILARQALFDTNRDVREKAIDALKKRPREQYREVLLDGFRHPWPPVAAHSAEALVALGDRRGLFRLAALLGEPDPRAPIRDEGGKWVVREVARINHLRNCLLCHPPSIAEKDPLRGAVPTPGERLTPGYRGRQKGDFVRADVTYLRQDFSLMERVAKPERWPAVQRFDYAVRTRELTPEERAAFEKNLCRAVPGSYPQRDAVLFALRELTGQDAGDSSAGWYEILCDIETDGGH